MLRCSPEAFAKCPTRHICGNPQEATFMEGSECDRFNQSVMDKPVTNADRIRAMSDEELVEFINHFNVCDNRSGDECRRTYIANCAACVLDWLQQPAKEDV